MKTLEKYRIEHENERGGWRSLIGAAMAFIGLVVFANVTLVALFFRQALSLPTELMFIAIGGVVGIAGLTIRGYKRELVILTAITVLGGMITTLVVNLLESQFGLLGLLIFGAIMAWCANRLFSRVDE
jgi:hypothetical protein